MGNWRVLASKRKREGTRTPCNPPHLSPLLQCFCGLKKPINIQRAAVCHPWKLNSINPVGDFRKKKKILLSDCDCMFHASQIVLNIHSPISSSDQINTISDSITVHFTCLDFQVPLLLWFLSCWFATNCLKTAGTFLSSRATWSSDQESRALSLFWFNHSKKFARP